LKQGGSACWKASADLEVRSVFQDMMEKLRTLVWYSVLLVIILVLYRIASTYTVAIVDEDCTLMEPSLAAKSICFLNRRRPVVESLAPNDLIAFEFYDGRRLQRVFGRVMATPGMTVSGRNGRLLVDGAEAGSLPPELGILETGLIVPRSTVFVGFDAKDADFALANRLVPYRKILGRVVGK